MRKAEILLATLLALTSATSAADDVRVEASVEPASRASDTEPIQLVVRVESSGAVDLADPKLPPLKNLRVVSGPAVSRSNSFSMVNFDVKQTSTVTLVYTLMAQATGPAEIPSIELTANGRVFRTTPLKLEIGRGQTGPAPGRAGPREDLPGALDPGQQADVFLRADVSKKEVWVGEPLVLDVTLYTAIQLYDVRALDLPSLSGFWSNDIKVDADAETRLVTIEGRSYRSIPGFRKILVPTTAGTKTIEPYAVEARIPVRSRDPFRDFFGPRVAPVTRKSLPVEVRVKPLPEAGRPASFSGAVGTFTVEAGLDRAEARVDDAVALRVRVEGEGSLQGVPPPKLETVSDVKIYEPKGEESTAVRSGRLESKKTWEWVVVPLVPGNARLPEVAFSWFDPKTGSYRETAKRLGPLVVSKGLGSEPVAAAPAGSRIARREIAFAKVDGSGLTRDSRPLHARPLGMVLTVAPWLLAPAFVGLNRWRLRRAGGAAGRRRRAAARARRALSEAESLARADDAAAFHAAAARALLGYVADRFGRAASGLTYDDIEHLLAERGVPEPARRALRSSLETCDYARFVPGSASPEARGRTLAEARAAIDALEEAP